MRLSMLAFALCSITATAHAQTVPACTPTTTYHQRWAMKTRQEPATFTAAQATSLSVSDIVKWAVPKGKNLNDSVINPHENETISVTGYVRLVKLAADDCDLHIQLGQYPDKHVPQIIVEIPQSETENRKALAELLGVKIHAPGGKAIFFDGAKSVKVVVTGLAFDDASHWSKAHPKTGNNHGSGVSTLWEVHPVWSVAAVR